MIEAARNQSEIYSYTNDTCGKSISDKKSAFSEKVMNVLMVSDAKRLTFCSKLINWDIHHILLFFIYFMIRLVEARKLHMVTICGQMRIWNNQI